MWYQQQCNPEAIVNAVPQETLIFMTFSIIVWQVFINGSSRGAIAFSWLIVIVLLNVNLYLVKSNLYLWHNLGTPRCTFHLPIVIHFTPFIHLVIDNSISFLLVISKLFSFSGMTNPFAHALFICFVSSLYALDSSLYRIWMVDSCIV